MRAQPLEVIADLNLCDRCVWKVTIDMQDNDDILQFVSNALEESYISSYFDFDSHLAANLWDLTVHAPLGLPKRRMFLPLINYVLVQSIGLDYATAKAKDSYLGRLRLLRNKETVVLTARRNVRQKLVTAARKIYSSNIKPIGATVLPSAQVKYWSSSFLPIDRMDEVLFAAEDLNRDDLLKPVRDGMIYPDDPTLKIRTRLQASKILDDAVKVDDLATGMLKQLFSDPNKFTKLVDLAVAYHTARLRSSLTIDGLKDASEKASMNPKQNAPNGPSPQVQYLARSKAILAKLHIEPDVKTGAIVAIPSRQYTAISMLPRFLEASCTTCPHTGYLARVGLAEVIEHVRKHHSNFFWGTAPGGSQEEFFKIIR
jgi:hypothetical protein